VEPTAEHLRTMCPLSVIRPRDSDLVAARAAHAAAHAAAAAARAADKSLLASHAPRGRAAASRATRAAPAAVQATAGGTGSGATTRPDAARVAERPDDVDDDGVASDLEHADEGSSGLAEEDDESDDPTVSDSDDDDDDSDGRRRRRRRGRGSGAAASARGRGSRGSTATAGATAKPRGRPPSAKTLSERAAGYTSRKATGSLGLSQDGSAQGCLTRAVGVSHMWLSPYALCCFVVPPALSAASPRTEGAVEDGKTATPFVQILSTDFAVDA
jgi:hypothetical protein